MNDNESDFLTTDEAISALPDIENVHTFRNPGGMLLGADFSKEKMIDVIRESGTIKKTGEAAQSMGHGMVIEYNGSLLFIETKTRT